MIKPITLDTVQQLLGATDQELIATYTQDLVSSQNELSYWTGKYNEDPEDPTNIQQKNYWAARVAVLQNLISRGAAYIRAGVSQRLAQGVNIVDQGIQSMLNTLNKVTNLNYAAGNNLVTQAGNFFTNQIAGIPVWSWFLLLGAGAYLIFQK